VNSSAWQLIKLTASVRKFLTVPLERRGITPASINAKVDVIKNTAGSTGNCEPVDCKRKTGGRKQTWHPLY